MSEIGDSILREYVSEVTERIEDDKNRIRLSQGLSIAHSIWLLFKYAINYFFLGFLVIGVVFLLTIDEAAIDVLRSASNEDILNGITVLSRIVQIFMVFSVFLVPFLGFKMFFRNKKQERLDREQEQLELIRTIVQINEEVLFRHGLIKREVLDRE